MCALLSKCRYLQIYLPSYLSLCTKVDIIFHFFCEFESISLLIRQLLVAIHFSTVWKSAWRDFKLVLVRLYITMRIVSAFIFVKVTLLLHGNTVLNAALFGKSALYRHATIRLSLTQINADMMLMVMDHLSQPSLKPLQMRFHTTVRWMDTADCMVGRWNTMLFLRKGQHNKDWTFFVVIGVKDAKPLCWFIKRKHTEQEEYVSCSSTDNRQQKKYGQFHLRYIRHPAYLVSSLEDHLQRRSIKELLLNFTEFVVV